MPENDGTWIEGFLIFKLTKLYIFNEDEYLGSFMLFFWFCMFTSKRQQCLILFCHLSSRVIQIMLVITLTLLILWLLDVLLLFGQILLYSSGRLYRIILLLCSVRLRLLLSSVRLRWLLSSVGLRLLLSSITLNKLLLTLSRILR